jgi:NAD(P)-dependent dehydrogenase (short-subunit alcohol dehydrogenase family)
MNLGLEGRIALVAGAGRGLGRAIALSLAREGADVIVTSRTLAELDAVAAEARTLGRRALAIEADLTYADALDHVFTEARAQLGAPTLLVLNAAALYQPKKLHNVTDAEAAELLAVDLGAAIGLCLRALPGMLEARHGRIVAVGSVAARTGVAGGSLYAAAKAALEGLVRGLAVDYSRYGITANVAAVGVVETERLQARVAGDPAARERLVKATALRRIPAVAEVADAIAFLCSDRASAITGSVLDVTAGAHLNNLW